MREARAIVGVDCGEQRHRFVMINEVGERVASYWVENELGKIFQALEELGSLSETARLEVVTESIGSLGALVSQAVRGRGDDLYLVSTKALRHYRDLEGQPRKSDDRDAYLAARMRLFDMEGVRTPAPVSEDEQALARLIRLRFQLMDQKKALGLRLRSRLLELAPVMASKDWEGPRHSSRAMVAILQRWPGLVGLERAHQKSIEKLLRKVSRDGDACIKMAKHLREAAKMIGLEGLARDALTMEMTMLVAQLETNHQQLEQVRKREKELVDAHPVGQRLLTMPSVGYRTAAVLLAEALPEARVRSEAQLATYSGLTPLSRQSGNSSRSRLCRGVNRFLASAHYMSAVNASLRSPIDRSYHDKKRKDFKGHPAEFKKATIALARQRHKVIYRILAIGEVYDSSRLAASTVERGRKSAA
jgi:transposase